MKVLFFTFSLLLVAFSSHSASFDVRLIINNGSILLTGGTTVPGVTFSESETFSQNSDILIWTAGDDVNLRVVNFDNIDHGFVIDGYVNYGTIAAGDSIEQNIVLSNEGVYRYYDPIGFPYMEYIGLSGILHVKDATDNTPYFYWDIREFQESWSSLIVGGGSPVLNMYNPEYFTINGNGNPNINADPIARVTGNVGNEFKIVMVNNGLSIHSMHFHGYHLFIEADSKTSSSIGREKDTFPLYPKEHMILSCTPDKEGEYPVHDHNLVAVTGGTQYANGMFTTMLIAP